MDDLISQAKPWQIALVIAVYISYLYLVLKGGTKNKPITIRKLLSVPLVMLIATIAAYDGMSGWTSWVILGIAVVIAVVQGLLLGHSKIVEKIDDRWCVRHDKRYLIIWFSFYGLKVALTAFVVVLFQGEFHLWFGVFYFLIFSSLRSVLVWIKYRKASLAERSR